MRSGGEGSQRERSQREGRGKVPFPGLTLSGYVFTCETTGDGSVDNISLKLNLKTGKELPIITAFKISKITSNSNRLLGSRSQHFWISSKMRAGQDSVDGRGLGLKPFVKTRIPI